MINVTLNDITAFVTALGPFVAPAIVTVDRVIGALQGAGVMTEADADAELRAVIGDAMAAKMESDRAARGEDTR